MVEAQEVQDRGVQVVNVDLVFDGLEAELVGRAVDVAALDAAAGQPHREAVVVMVAAVHLALIRARSRQLDGRRAAELAAPDDQRVVEHPALFQILQEGADGLVALPAQLAMTGLEVVVIVPGLSLTVPELDEPHAPLQQPPCGQERSGVNARAVKGADVGGLLADVKRLGRLRLHPVGQLERLDPRLELGLVPVPVKVLSIELGQEIELSPLSLWADAVVANVLDQLLVARSASA